ncbi:MAG: hypothetical protein REI78_13480 [Pedobacter sp.]|nr:hypothetical protein [Pedobacter sp.]MDQ8054040.1 hypothetical protein [Pedobacter sp.]
MQNRVDPFGNIIATAARGQWLGNRGQLHGQGKTILRPFKHQAWIICALQFKGRHREIMAPNLWTELFFLDEATALAAGHRPCFECRREAAVRFKTTWIMGNPGHGFHQKTLIGQIDAILQTERINAHKEKVTFREKAGQLPNGTFIAIAAHPYLVVDGMIYPWNPFGYGAGQLIDPQEEVTVLTPRSIVAAIKTGYSPQISLANVTSI